MIKNKQKIFVGVSGGVDSSVSLAILKDAGYDVTGVFLKVWHPDFLPCDWKEERRSAMRVCAKLSVPFLTLDCEADYKKEVADYMIREYSLGRTPNPDIFCNKYVKFGVFLKKALEMGANFVATGHYAQNKFIKKTNEYELHESVDQNKDQSYFLYTLGQSHLKHILFPVGDMKKSEVRKLAKKYGLPTADKKDSQGICFLGDIDMKEFLSHYIKTSRGDILNTAGEVIGDHFGALFYTIGSRHGFNVIKKSSNDGRYFVLEKDIEKNTITVATKELEKEKLENIKEVVVRDLHIISEKYLKFPLQTSVRIRYHQEKQKCMVSKKDDGYHIVFEKLQSGIAVGQSAVLYTNTQCLGGGIIEKII